MKSTVMYKLIFIILSCKGMDTKRTCNNISECFALLLLVHMDKKNKNFKLSPILLKGQWIK